MTVVRTVVAVLIALIGAFGLSVLQPSTTLAARTGASDARWQAVPDRSGNAPIRQASPDLTVTKSNNVSGLTTVGSTWTWVFAIRNQSGLNAVFTPGQTVLLDNLPDTGNVSYPSVFSTAVGGVTGTLACAIDGARNLTCQPSGGNVTIPAGTGFDVTMQATTLIPGGYVDPRAGGVCQVDPGGAVAESNDGNNSCSDTVTVVGPDLTATKTNNVGGSATIGAPWTWTITLLNSGNTPATFTTGQRLLLDTLPDASVTYGSPTVTPFGGAFPTVACSIASANLTCDATGEAIIPVSGGYTVAFSATGSAPLAYANPRASGSCLADPNGVVGENSETNNACADTVTIPGPDLTATKTNNVAGVGTVGSPWTWSTAIANGGTATATFAAGQVVLQDDLPNTGLQYGLPGITTTGSPTGTLSCAISGTFTLTCSAAAGGVTIPVGSSFVASVAATPTSTGAYANPRSGGTCQVDPGSAVLETNEGNNTCANQVTVGALPDLSVTKTNNVAGAAQVGATWIWTLTVLNNGAATTFADGQIILSDGFPDTNLTYSQASVGSTSGVSGALFCHIDFTFRLTCSAAGGSVTLAAGSSLQVSFPVTATAAGTFANPRVGLVCLVDPNGVIAEANETNNTCADTVTVTAIAPTGVTVSPTPTPEPEPYVKPDDDDDKPRLTETQRRQRERTNASGQDDERTEGNVLEVRCDASSPPQYDVSFPTHTPYLVIATRDGNQQLRLTKKAARDQCQYIRVGDYAEAEGDKEHELLFNAHDLDVKKR